jgi:GNAT superfamily N-acetyltransferase
MQAPINYRIAIDSPNGTLRDRDLNTIARHFYQLWLDNGVPETGIKPDWQEIIHTFTEGAIQELEYRAFIAEINGHAIGSVSCQLYSGLYPNALAEHQRKYGYIWGVYVELEYRRQGIGKHLTEMAIEYLKTLHCTRVLLHAAPAGRSVYESLGFTTSNEMWLDF